MLSFQTSFEYTKPKNFFNSLPLGWEKQLLRGEGEPSAHENEVLELPPAPRPHNEDLHGAEGLQGGALLRTQVLHAPQPRHEDKLLRVGRNLG